MEAHIFYRGGDACYRIQQEAEGIFTAHLLSYSAVDAEDLPPYCITLVRGIRYWTGSVKDEILLSELGKFIDTNQLAFST